MGFPWGVAGNSFDGGILALERDGGRGGGLLGGTGAGGEGGGGDVVHGAGIGVPVGLDGGGLVVEEIVTVLAHVEEAFCVVGLRVALEAGDKVIEGGGGKVGLIVRFREGVSGNPGGVDAGGV